MSNKITIEQSGETFEHGEYEIKRLSLYEYKIEAQIELVVSPEFTDIFIEELQDIIKRYCL